MFVFVEFFYYVWFDFNGANVLGLHFVNHLQSAKQLGGKWLKDLGEVISFGLDGAQECTVSNRRVGSHESYSQIRRTVRVLK